jgi:hypothetical protein
VTNAAFVRRHRGAGILAFAALLSSACGGCSQNARISRMRGPAIVGHIDRSDRDNLYVTNLDGARYVVERSDIVDVKHPGGSEALGGLLGTAACSLLLWVSYAHSDPKNESGFVGIPRAMAALGIAFSVPVTLAFGSSYLGSRVAAGSSAPPPPRPAP